MMRSAAYALLCLPAIALAQPVPEESAWKDLVLAVYRHAVAERYWFYSYGDCMLIV